jgi:hypothetical protein
VAALGGLGVGCGHVGKNAGESACRQQQGETVRGGEFEVHCILTGGWRIANVV